MNKVRLAHLLQLFPALLVLLSFAASIYAAINEISGITYGSSVFLGTILTVWIIGVVIERRARKQEQ